MTDESGSSEPDPTAEDGTQPTVRLPHQPGADAAPPAGEQRSAWAPRAEDAAAAPAPPPAAAAAPEEHPLFSAFGPPSDAGAPQPGAPQPGAQQPGTQFGDTAAYPTFAQPATPPGPYVAGSDQPAAPGTAPGGPWVPPAAPGAGGSGSGGVGRIVVAAVIAGLLAGALGGAGGYLVASRSSSSSVLSPGISLPQSNASLSARADDSIAAIAKRVTPSVVSISVTTGQGGDTGSGVILRSDGYILTNNHVIAAAAGGGGNITVSFSDGTTKPAKIVGRDTSYDLAVVKVDATGLPAATLGNSDDVVVGDAAIAIGSPLGLQGTVTSGIISAIDRPVTAGGSGESSYINAIQTDAAINPGNSGGALVDAQGKVIGINSAIASLGAQDGGQSGSIGLGFAIPINQAKRISEELISTGKSTHPVIGVTLDQGGTANGVRVASVTPGGPAAGAGIEPGDVITAVDGRTVSTAVELVVAIRANNPGDKITLTVQRGSETREVELTLGADSSG